MPLPAVVAPGPPLTAQEAERFARHLFLPSLGELGQRRLRAAKVAVIGVGGLGSPALQYLAGAGVGTVGLFDDDVVEISNLHRQVLHTVADVGRPKVDSGAEHLLALSPDLQIHRHRVRLEEDNTTDLLRGYDLVLDGTDNFTTRYVVNDACAELGIPLIWASIFRTDAQVSVFWSRPPQGVEPRTLRDLFPAPPPPGSVPSCAEGGVLGALCGQVGALMASEAIKLITGTGQPLLGRVLILDSLTAQWQQIPLRPRSAAPAGSRSTPQHRPVATTAPDAPPTTERSAVEPFTRVAPADLQQRLQAREAGEQDFVLLDVREPSEHAEGVIPGATLVPLAQALTHNGRAGLEKDVPVIVYCAAGPRAERAARELAGAGYTTSVLTGGIGAWREL